MLLTGILITQSIWQVFVCSEIMSHFAIYYIPFPGFKGSQNDCRMWNRSYKYKTMYSTTEVFT
jgi:hypothetical protein